MTYSATALKALKTGIELAIPHYAMTTKGGAMIRNANIAVGTKVKWGKWDDSILPD